MPNRYFKRSTFVSPLWMYTAAPEDAVKALAQACHIDVPVARVLWNRGFKTPDEANDFLTPLDYTLADPYLMHGMDLAVERLLQAVNRREPIVVYGDYDVDGQVSVAVLVSVLRGLGGQVAYYVPHRLEEGYGLNRDSVAEAAHLGRLLVTVDCGITSVDEVAYAGELGMDCIVTDHHEPGPQLPAAVAILNPKQAQCTYPDKSLAGCGVVYALVRALYAKMGMPGDAGEQWLDLIALGTVADVVPLLGENRALVAKGLPLFSKRVGLRALCDAAGVDPLAVTAGQIGFRLGPRLNAAGRLDDASVGVQLLLTEDEAEAATIAAALNEQNEQRQRIEQRILTVSHDHVAHHAHLEKDNALVVDGEGWHKGVIGIVASRLVEAYGRPTLVISVNGEEAVGSGRSISGFDLHGALSGLRHYFTRFGGHRAAAGFSLPAADIPAFRADFLQAAGSLLHTADLQPVVRVDAVVTANEATVHLASQFGRLGPFGFGNPEPVVAVHGREVADSRTMGREQTHWRIALAGPDQNTALSAVGFGMAADYAGEFTTGAVVDAAGSLGINEWQGRVEPQLRLRDVTEHRVHEHGAVESLLHLGAASERTNAAALLPMQETVSADFPSLRLFHVDMDAVEPQAGGDVLPRSVAMTAEAYRRGADVVLAWLHGEGGITSGVRLPPNEHDSPVCYLCYGTIPPTATRVPRAALMLWSVPSSAAQLHEVITEAQTWAHTLDLYADFSPQALAKAREHVAADIPPIDVLRQLYSALQRTVGADGGAVFYRAIAQSVTAAGHPVSEAGVRYGLHVFFQAGLLHWTEQTKRHGIIRFTTSPGVKVDLTRVVRYNEGEQQRLDILAYFNHIQHMSLPDIMASLAQRAVSSS